jgi:uncharacterized SAM-binding protein YcdF (DUF218 family)
MKEETLRLARIIWDYHHLHHEPIPADVIIALGSHDLRVAEFAADLYLRGYGKTLVCTGGIAHQSDLLAAPWTGSEAEMFAQTAEKRGVPRDRILLETQALNTAENISFTRDLLGRHRIRPRNVLIAVKPFMQRRAWATMAVRWPEMPATVASPPLTLDQYFTAELTPERVIHILVGDLQRLWVYARRGFSAPQAVPPEVRQAYESLVAMGFTGHLIAE